MPSVLCLTPLGLAALVILDAFLVIRLLLRYVPENKITIFKGTGLVLLNSNLLGRRLPQRVPLLPLLGHLSDVHLLLYWTWLMDLIIDNAKVADHRLLVTRAHLVTAEGLGEDFGQVKLRLDILFLVVLGAALLILIL